MVTVCIAMVTHDKYSNAAMYNHHKSINHYVSITSASCSSLHRRPKSKFLSVISSRSSDHNPNDHSLKFTDQKKPRKQKLQPPEKKWNCTCKFAELFSVAMVTWHTVASIPSWPKLLIFWFSNWSYVKSK